MESWASMLKEAFEENGESWGDVEEVQYADVPAEAGSYEARRKDWGTESAKPPADMANLPFLAREFDSGFGGEEGYGFTLWTSARVYFPVCYDGAESVASVPRNPANPPAYTRHVGG